MGNLQTSSFRMAGERLIQACKDKAKPSEIARLARAVWEQIPNNELHTAYEPELTTLRRHLMREHLDVRNVWNGLPGWLLPDFTPDSGVYLLGCDCRVQSFLAKDMLGPGPVQFVDVNLRNGTGGPFSVRVSSARRPGRFLMFESDIRRWATAVSRHSILASALGQALEIVKNQDGEPGGLPMPHTYDMDRALTRVRERLRAEHLLQVVTAEALDSMADLVTDEWGTMMVEEKETRI